MLLLLHGILALPTHLLALGPRRQSIGSLALPEGPLYLGLQHTSAEEYASQSRKVTGRKVLWFQATSLGAPCMCQTSIAMVI